MHAEHNELITQLSGEIDHYHAERERLLRKQEIVSHSVIVVKRHLQAAVSELERAESRLAGINQYGIKD